MGILKNVFKNVFFLDIITSNMGCYLFRRYAKNFIVAILKNKMASLLKNKMASTDRECSPFYIFFFSVMAEDR